jgi:hypothetical protein
MNTVQSFLQKSPGPPSTSLPSSHCLVALDLPLPHSGGVIVQSGLAAVAVDVVAVVAHLGPSTIAVAAHLVGVTV